MKLIRNSSMSIFENMEKIQKKQLPDFTSGFLWAGQGRVILSSAFQCHLNFNSCLPVGFLFSCWTGQSQRRPSGELTFPPLCPPQVPGGCGEEYKAEGVLAEAQWEQGTYSFHTYHPMYPPWGVWMEAEWGKETQKLDQGDDPDVGSHLTRALLPPQ